MTGTSTNSIRYRSLALTLLIHALLFLALLFFMIHIPVPPFPEAAGGNGGVLVNIGYDESGLGDVQPMSENDPAYVKPVNQTSKSVEEENVATQDLENVSVSHPTKKDIKKKNEKVKLDKNTADTKKVPDIEMPVRVANSASLYHGKKNNSTSQGITSGNGDQGDPNGDPNSNAYGKNGDGTGNGNGNGTGDGNGDGKGGFGFSLAGRKIIQKPIISDRSQETGKVVVEITVDKFGKVTKASPGARGTTTTSQLLFALAKQSALTAKFNASPSAAEEQKGTITFVFIVQ